MEVDSFARVAEYAPAEFGAVQLVPWTEAAREWRALSDASSEATLFHSLQWIEAMITAYALKVVVATVRTPGGAMAAGLPMSIRGRRLVAFPFSDYAPPLEREAGAAAALVAGLVRMPGRPVLEIRGWDAPPPWHRFTKFERWVHRIDLPLPALERGFGRNFRREIRRGRENAIEIERARGAEALERFYRLLFQARHRMGIPTQPRRFFEIVYQAFGEEAQIWFAKSEGEDISVEFAIAHRECLYGKWMARADRGKSGASQLMLSEIVRNARIICRRFDLGRADSRNQGLINFKRQQGAEPMPCPYVFYPDAPGEISSENLRGARKVLSRVWPKLPAPLARALGAAVYRLSV